MQGMEEAVLSDITAVVSRSESNRYQGCLLSETAQYTTTNAGAEMPVSNITESSVIVSLEKYGRTVKATYEAVRQQRLDVFALMLRRVGRELADSIVSHAITILKSSANASKITISGNSLAYSDLAALYGEFTSFRMKALLASPAVTAEILVMNQMLEASSEDVTEIRLPFGTKLINCPQIDDNSIIGIDTDFALEQIQSSDIVLETDKLIDRQLDCIGISVNIGFRTLMTDAVKLLSLSAS